MIRYLAYGLGLILVSNAILIGYLLIHFRVEKSEKRKIRVEKENQADEAGFYYLLAKQEYSNEIR